MAKGKIALAAGLVLVGSAVSVLWLGRTGSATPLAVVTVEARDGRVFGLQVTRARSLAIAESCSLGHGVALLGKGRLPRKSSGAPARSPECIYAVVTGARKHECLLEYSAAQPLAVTATNWSAKLAAVYYEKFQGGLVHFASNDLPKRSFVMVDRRWCTLFGAAPHLKVIDGIAEQPANQAARADRNTSVAALPPVFRPLSRETLGG